ncbi:hypothetical protein [Halobacillus aidingensis]|uniref:ComG operon protein 7 n=1 Tax=Halobacillus aidingensis TaxID=240303 RepID=A0A1H0JN43_HALAD|nr:hypothetical protein [Halobacillus aidingensis]SDO44869.1 hypothetical protein SAMN05421677_10572 [Halobacillus aidingensis]
MTNPTREKSIFHNAHGIVFPWVLIFCFLLLIVTLTTINQYKNHLILIKSHQASVVKQHILDTSRMKLDEELETIPLEQMQYSSAFLTPDGESVAECTREESQWVCLWNIVVNGNQSQVRTFQRP